MIGPEYLQIALKTEKAASRLHWLSAKMMSPEELAICRETVAAVEAVYQELFASEIEKITANTEPH